MRLAEAHGVPRLAEMMTQVEVPWFELAQGMHADVVAASVKADLAALTLDTGIVSRTGVLLRGELLRRRQWSVHDGRRACPRCLAADAPRAGDPLPRAWHRNWWDVRSVTVCPIHHVRLIGRCASCGAKLDFHSTPVAKCPLGHPLAMQPSGPVEGVSGDAYVVGRLGGMPRSFVKVLDAGPLGEAIEILELIGATSLAGHRLRDVGKFAKHEVLHAGCTVISHWPGALDTMLETLAATAAIGPGKWGAAATYGRFHSRLLEINGPIAGQLKDRVRRHALASGVAISKPVFGVSQAPTEVCSIRHAAERLGMGFERARREFGVRGCLPNRTRRGTPIRISTAMVDAIAAQHRGRIGVAALAGRLAIGRTQTRRLASLGLFGVGPIVSADVDAFVKRLSGTVKRFGGAGATPLPEGCRTARCALDVAVPAILDGRLRPVGFRHGSGLAGVLVRLVELRALGKQSRDAMPLDDAAALLGVKWEALRGLVGLRLIRRGRRGIRRDDLDAFHRDFVACARLAQAAGLRPRTVIKLLAGEGLAPVAAPPRCRQVFYRRNDVLKTRGVGSKYSAIRIAAGRR